IDDGSTDDTEGLMKIYSQKDSRIKFHRRPKNYKAGGNGARNYGFDISKGEYLNWFDSDDVMIPEKLSLQVSRLINSNKIISISKAVMFEKDIHTIVSYHNKIKSEDYFIDFLNQNLTVLTQVPLIKREFIKNNNIQLFNENLKAAQEWEFFSRLFYVTNHNDVDIIDKETVYIRKHQNSITRNSNFNREFEYYKAR